MNIIRLSLAVAVLLCLAGVISQAQNMGAQASSAKSRSQVTDIVANSRKIVTANGIDELKEVPINGIQQWISVRGHDRRNPILLFLHGGPGSPDMPADYSFQTPWEEYFTVVQWDQRGAGKTYASNDPAVIAPTMTIDQMTSDAEEVVKYLLQTYHKRKIILVAHSWGTVLGLKVAIKHPEWLYAYVGVGQMIDMRQSEAEGFAWTLGEAKSHGNLEAVKELESLEPYPGKTLTFARTGLERKWLAYYGGLVWGRHDASLDGGSRYLSPDYTDRDLDLTDEGSRFSLTQLLGPLGDVNFDNVTQLKCPLFLFVGRHDYTTSHTLAEAWFNRVQAPEKKLLWFENSAHFMMEEEPGHFLIDLVRYVRPLAEHDGDVAPENQ